MANAFKRYTAVGVTSETTIFTCPTSPTTTSILIGLLIANVHASAQADVTAQVVTTGAAADPKIISEVPVPKSSSLEVMEGKIVMEAGDVLKVTSTQTVDVTLSVLEQP